MKLRPYSNLVSATVITAGLSLMYRFTSATSERVFIAGHPFDFQCVFKRTTGIPCPGCGGSRSFVMALHGDFLQALKMNPMGVIFLIGLVSLAIGQFIFVASNLGYFQWTAQQLRRILEPRPLAILTYSVFAVGIGQWIFKLISH